MADVWPVQRWVLVVPQEKASVVVAIQQRVFLRALYNSVIAACNPWRFCIICCTRLLAPAAALLLTKRNVRLSASKLHGNGNATSGAGKSTEAQLTLPTRATSRLALSSMNTTPCCFAAAAFLSSTSDGGCRPPAMMTVKEPWRCEQSLNPWHKPSGSNFAVLRRSVTVKTLMQGYQQAPSTQPLKA